MKVCFLKIRDFRNIRDLWVKPCSGINVFVGSNGQGKTSLLEALGFLSSLRSFRNTKACNVIRQGTLSSDIQATLNSSPNPRLESLERGLTHIRLGEELSSDSSTSSSHWETQLRVGISKPQVNSSRAQKLAFVNQKPLRSSTQYLSQRFGAFHLGFHAVVFNPSDHDLVTGGPDERRRFLDRALAAEDIHYLTNLKKYQKLLEQRNAILRTPGSHTHALLASYTAPYCQVGSELTLSRLIWLKRLRERLETIIDEIAPSQGQTKIIYHSQWAPEVSELVINNKNLSCIDFSGHAELPSLKLLERKFHERVVQLGPAEQKSGFSLVGPHRDDWAFYLDGQLLKEHGSQGECRSALLALKLAEVDLFRGETGHRPIFLLDDFSSELDRERRQYLMKFLKDTDLQTFITTTELSGLGADAEALNGAQFVVHGGQLSPVVGSTFCLEGSI